MHVCIADQNRYCHTKKGQHSTKENIHKTKVNQSILQCIILKLDSIYTLWHWRVHCYTRGGKLSLYLLNQSFGKIYKNKDIELQTLIDGWID